MKAIPAARRGVPGPRVLWITPNIRSTAGGPTSTVVNGLLAETSVGLGSELITTRGRDTKEEAASLERLTAGRVQVRLFPRFGPKRAASAWGLSPGLILWLIPNAHRFDVIHLQYVWSLTTVLGCLIGRLARVPVVLTPHESLTSYDIEVTSPTRIRRFLKRCLRGLVLRTVDALVLMSDLEIRDTASRDVPVYLVPHAVASNDESPPPSQTIILAESSGLKVGFVGRNIPKKGIDRLIRAINLNEDHGLSLFVAGPPAAPELQAEYDRLVAQLNLEERVHWLGFVEHRDSFLSALDILVLPSEYEGFGMAAAEAMNCGTPVVVARRSGIAELIEKHGGGLVVDTPEPPALSAALSRLGGPAALRAASAKARRAIEAEHSFEIFGSRMSKVYGSVIEAFSRPD